MTDASPNTATDSVDSTAVAETSAAAPAVDTDIPDWARDPQAALKIVDQLRKENASARQSAKETAAKDARDSLLRELGLIKDDQPIDPETFRRDMSAKDATIRDLQVKSALSDALTAAGAKPLARAAILGEGLLSDLDPAAADFASTVSQRVSEYVTKNPELKAARAAATSAVDSPGGESKPGRIYTRAQLNDTAFFQANKADILLAMREGRIH